MSDTTADPADAAAQGDPVDKPLGENGEKALKAERDARKAAEQRATELQTQLDAVNQANETAVEKAVREANQAREEAAKATADALRFRVASKHGISEDDADLFLTGTDAETLEKQAERLVERTPKGPKPDPSQGAKDQTSKGTTADSFAEFFNAHIS